MAEKELKKSKLPSLNRMKVLKQAPRRYMEPDEWYIGELQKAEIKPGNFGPYVTFTFKILNGVCEDGKSAKGLLISRLMDATFAIGKDIYKWACVLANKELEDGDDFNFTSYYGDKLRIYVRDKEKKKGAASDVRYQEVKTIKRRKKKVK